MNFNQFRSIYPSTFLTDDTKHDPAYLTFPYQDQWIHFGKKQLTASEKELLTLLFNKDTTGQNTEIPQSKWQKFLIENNPSPPIEVGVYRVIQFDINKKDTRFDNNLWLSSFKSFFEDVQEAFFVNDHYGLLIHRYSGYSITQDETTGFLQTIDDDFSTKTTGYIGQYWDISLNFKELFQEEQTIFFNQLKKNKQVFSLSDVALHYYASKALTKSPINQKIKRD